MYPEHFFHYINQKIKKEWRFAFCSALCMGLLIHMFRLTNHLLTWDSVYNFHSDQNVIHLGRCFLTLTCGIGSYYDLQWVNGLLSLIYLSLVSVCLTELFSLKKKVCIFLMCGITVSFPSVASTFAYMYTADGYFLAQLLVTLAVLITLKCKKGFLPGIFLFALAAGSYQAYISYAVMLILTWSALQLLWEKLSVRQLLGYWVRFLLMGSIGIGFYLIANKLLTVLEGASASDYNGISTMSIPDARGLVLAAKNCIIDFAYFFFGPLDSMNFYKILNASLILLLLLLFCHLVWKQKLYQKWGNLLMALVCLGAMPFACSMIYFLSPSVRYYMLMYAGFSLIYLLPVLFYENMNDSEPAVKSGLSPKLLLSWGCIVLTVLTVFNFILISNISYLYMVTSNEKTFQLVSRMTDRIEHLEDYPSAKKLCLLGHFEDYDTISLTLPPAMAGIRDSVLISEQEHFVAMMETYFGLSLENCSEEEQKQIQSSALFAGMDCWPAADSVVLEGDTVIIKIGEE